MDSQKPLIGLIGAGISQSLSPAMHEEEARHHGLDLHYQLIDLDRTGAGVEALPALISAARTMGFAGLNITFPCKQAVLPLLDELSADARAMGAVNTVVNDDGHVKGILSIDDLIRHTGPAKGQLPAEAVVDVLRHICAQSQPEIVAVS